MLNNRVGDIAEMKFQLQAALRGFAISKPFGGSSRYDYILDNGTRLFRVQVKSCLSRRKSRAKIAYQVTTRTSSDKPYTEKDIDVLVAYSFEADCWWIIPVSEINGRVSMVFSEVGDLVKYKNSWEFFNPDI